MIYLYFINFSYALLIFCKYYVVNLLYIIYYYCVILIYCACDMCYYLLILLINMWDYKFGFWKLIWVLECIKSG